MEVVGGVSDWEELGRQLGISSRKITQLVKDGGGIEHCREEVVLEWLKGDNTASWEKLCEALERMGRKDEVLIINEQYLQAQGLFYMYPPFYCNKPFILGVRHSILVYYFYM